MSLKRNEFTEHLYLAGLLVLVTGLPLSMFLMSVGQILLASSWLISGNYLQKLKSFFSDRITLLIASVFLLHLIGFLWSDDWAYAYKDARIKFPLLILPLIIYGSKPLSRVQFMLVLKVFIAAVFLGSLASMAVLTGLIDKPVKDIRDISLFISHIRFGLLICIAIFCLFWMLINEQGHQKPGFYVGKLILMLWFLIFLVILEAMTGLVVMYISMLIGGGWLLFKSPYKLVKIVSLFPYIVLVFLAWQVITISSEVTITVHTDVAALDSVTSQGNLYSNKIPYDDTENGHPIWIYICQQEIDSLWPLRSKLDIKGKDLKGQELYFTLIRYLSSKGLRKDADGLRNLDDEDIRAVEKGFTNYRFTTTSNVYARIYQVVWEYHHYLKHGNPEGHSVMQRLEFWKTGLEIFREHPFVGVGTGDVQQAFDRQYEMMNSPLPKEWRLRAHNQYITFALTFGVGGLILFLSSLLYPYSDAKNRKNLLFSFFLLAASLSFLNEDTLETQAGATFFAFFNAFFLFANGNRNSV